MAKKIITVVGARPQFVKAAMVSKAIIDHNRKGDGETIEEILLHTGQHYDRNMSEIFFDQMGIPRPGIRLDCGGGTHGAMTGKMLAEIEKALFELRPDAVLVYGDTDSTLAGALAAAKLHIPVVHVEAGLRSFNKAMPEEINRVLTDHVSDLLLCPTREAVAQLNKEGIVRGVHQVGDVMYDAALAFGKLADKQSKILQDTFGKAGAVPDYFLVTCHRAENTDDEKRLRAIFEALLSLVRAGRFVVLPLHPRTARALEKTNLLPQLKAEPHFLLLPPVSFLDMVMLEKHAKVILTDSGGVQKEAYFRRVPCVTLRDETEWVETVEAGWNSLAGSSSEAIISLAKLSWEKCSEGREDIPDYGTGNTSNIIIGLLFNLFQSV